MGLVISQFPCNILEFLQGHINRIAMIILLEKINQSIVGVEGNRLLVDLCCSSIGNNGVTQTIFIKKNINSVMMINFKTMMVCFRSLSTHLAHPHSK